jgi:hypothetical protein
MFLADSDELEAQARANGSLAIEYKNRRRMQRSPSLARFEVAQFSREATVADSCGRQPAEIGGKEFKAAERRQQFVAAVAASRLCVPFPLVSVGFRPRLSAFAAFAADNCATSKLALRVSVVGHAHFLISAIPGGSSASFS